ncbi:hypothetical protein [Halovivax cerinus]|uniref:Uncharacterized protein n=1 Tax=Halovivax cerinus TaxID=1487865 RepID=A0ABD5NL98_9EURY|nr:hypothetical protein [Halovivax cerinus]
MSDPDAVSSVSSVTETSDEALPPEKFPKPPNVEEMTDDQIGEWYKNLLSPVEQAKHRRAAEKLLEGGRDPTEAEYRTLMNEFFADLSTPANLRRLEAKLKEVR